MSIQQITITKIVKQPKEVDFNELVYIVYNNKEYYIHNGIDTLVVLQGDASHTLAIDVLLSMVTGEGEYTLASAIGIDTALDAYNEWRNEIYQE